MAAKSSAQKRQGQSERARVRNKAYRSMLKSRTKDFLEAVAAGRKEEAQAGYRALAGILDKAAAKGILHRNTASRKKSRMSKALNRV